MKELDVIKRALDIANQKGCYNLEDSYTIFHSLKVIESKFNKNESTSVDKPEYTENTTSIKKPK